MQLLFKLLQNRVGSPTSYQSLAQDLAISPVTVKQYIQILEALFIIFRVTPYSRNIARSLLKEPKIYFFDTALVKGDEGAKLENFVAVSLLKHVYAKVDYQAKSYALHYLRLKDGHEVDFALVNDNTLESMIEVKVSNSDVSKSLAYFHKKYDYSAIQLVKNLRQSYRSGDIQILKVEEYLAGLLL
jgi:predicted AAA+ superfamily ATPase